MTDTAYKRNLKMNSLAKLPESILQLIFHNLEACDLQSLSETCSTFRRIIENSTELSQKLNDDPRSTFELMPIEILERIFSKLPSPDMCNVAASCRTFSSIINSSEKLSKTLTLHMRYPKDVQQFVEDISNSSRRFKSLHIHRARESTRLSDHLTRASMEEFYEFMKTNLGPDIENLSISWRNPSNIRDMNYTMELQRILQPIQRRMNIAANEHLHRMPLHILLHNLENNHPANPFDPAFEFEGGPQYDFRVRAQRFPANVREEDAAAAAQIRLQMNQIRDQLVTEFLDLIKYFTNVRNLELSNVNLERTRIGEIAIDFPRLSKLSLHECDHHSYTLFSNVTNLRTLNVLEGSTPRDLAIVRMERFEDFLFSQKSLKELKMENFYSPRFLIRDRTDEIQFKLNMLTFKNVHFANKEFTRSFIQSQNELKSIDFQMYNERSHLHSLDRVNFFNGFLSTITNGRRMQLDSISIDKVEYVIMNCEFLQENTNPYVKHLKFQVTADDRSSQLFKTLVKILPNLEVIEFKTVDSEESESICFDEGTILTKCHSLSITNSSVRSLVNVTAPMLVQFNYVPERAGEYIDDIFGGFFIRHRNIKTLAIGNCNQRSYFFVSYIMCKMIVDFLSNIEHITIYNFVEVNKSVKLLCSMGKLKSLTLSTEDHQQFTAKTKVECARNNLKLISVDIGSGELAGSRSDTARFDTLLLQLHNH